MLGVVGGRVDDVRNWLELMMRMIGGVGGGLLRSDIDVIGRRGGEVLWWVDLGWWIDGLCVGIRKVMWLVCRIQSVFFL